LDRYKGEISPYPLLLPSCSGRGDKKIYPPPHLYQGRRGEQTNKKKHRLATIF
jgi:hypothetical protein